MHYIVTKRVESSYPGTRLKDQCMPTNTHPQKYLHPLGEQASSNPGYDIAAISNIGVISVSIWSIRLSIQVQTLEKLIQFTFLQLTQLYELVPGYRLRWIFQFTQLHATGLITAWLLTFQSSSGILEAHLKQPNTPTKTVVG